MSEFNDYFKKLYMDNPIKIIADPNKIKEMVDNSQKNRSVSDIMLGGEVFKEGKVPDKLEATNEETRKQLLEAYGKYITCAKDYYAKSGITPTPEDLFQSALNEMAKEGKTTPNESIIKGLADECGFTLVNQTMYDEAIKVFKGNKKNEGKIPTEMTPNSEETRSQLREEDFSQAATDVSSNFQSITGIDPASLANGQELNDQAVADAFNKIVEYLKGKYPDIAQEPVIGEFQNALDGSLKAQYASSFEGIPECFASIKGEKLLEFFGTPGSNTADKSVDGYSVLATGISDQPTAQQIAQQKGGKVVTDANDPKKFMVILEESFFEGDLTEKALSRSHVNAVGKILRQIADPDLRSKIGDQFSDLVANGNPKFKHSKFKDYLNADDTKQVVDEQVPADNPTTPKDNLAPVEQEMAKESSDSITKENSEAKLKEAKEPVAADIGALKATVTNMYNYYLADDMDQAIEYAQLIVKQAGDVGKNMEKAKHIKGVTDKFNSGEMDSSSTLHQKTEQEIPGQDNMTAMPPAGPQHEVMGQNESKKLTEANIGDEVIYNGNGAKGYQGKKAKIIAINNDMAVIQFEDGATYKGAYLAKLVPATPDAPVDPVKQNVQDQRVDPLGAKKPFNQAGDDEQFELEKQFALPSKARESIEGLKKYIAELKAQKPTGNNLIDEQIKSTIEFCERGLKENAFCVGISTPHAVGTTGKMLTNQEDIKKAEEGCSQCKNGELKCNCSKGEYKKNEGKIPATLTATEEKTRKELLEAEAKEIQELAEKCFLAIKLGEKKTLTDKEKLFIESVNKIQIAEEKKLKVKDTYRKMFRGSIKK